MLEKVTSTSDHYLSILSAIIDNKFVIALVFFSAIMIIKMLLIRLVENKNKSNKKIKINMINNIVTVVLLIVVFNIWAEEIQKFAFSIAAFIVAIVLATREFIQCFIGFMYILSSRPYRIGDWIQVGNYYGEVHSTDWIKLTLLEVNIDSYEFTGKRSICLIAS
ncbi:mechanosensitive ion channel family protein [Psychromonas sp. MME2]|uniref:mechanosensitive ion channel family protein n=1 Tax=Psychromonas sp. MME2 TaxID=3231033 RepID=UPI00339C8073